MRPFSNTSEGKEFLMDLLRTNGFNNVVETTRYEHWDIEGEYGGEKWFFELKNRDFTSDRYGDVAINYDKYINLKNTEGRAILVYFWLDCWIMLDIKSLTPSRIFTNKTTRTTRFDDRSIIDKKWVSWDLKDMKIMRY